MAVIHLSCKADVLDTEVFYDKMFGIWSSPNVSTLRYPIPNYDMDIPSNIRLQDLRQPRWLSNTYPFIAFWPKSVDLSGPIFSRLNICDCMISVETVGPCYYRLNYSIIETWSRLEHALEGLAKFLLRKGHHRADLGLLPFPSDCGYKANHTKAQFVYHCAYKSRDAFIALSTICSFAIASLIDKDDHLRDEANWVKECRLEGVHPQWLEDLQQSFVCNFTPGFRVGAYVNGYLSRCARLFPAFKTANVPLLIWWGHNPHDIVDVDYMKSYLPTESEVGRAKFAYMSQPILPPPWRQPHIFQPSANEGSPPEPISGSYQRLGETLQDFLDRVRQELAKYEDTEDIQEHVARVNMERQAEHEQQDLTLAEPTIGSAMYEWKEVLGGHQLRTFVPRQEWKTRWRFSSPTTRWFHGLMNEWSIEVDKSTLNSDPNPTAMFDHIIELRGGRRPQSANDPVFDWHDGQQSSFVICPRFLDNPTSSAGVYAEDVEHFYGNLVSETKVVSHSLKDTLHKRYGFVACLPYVSDMRMKKYNKANTSIISDLSRIGLKEFQKDDLAQAAVDLYNFVQGNGSVPVAFPPLWDVGPTFIDRILNHSRLAHTKVDNQTHIIGIHTKSFEAQWYLILVPDASTVLQVFRDDDMGVLATVRCLLDWGIPFNTVKCIEKKPRKMVDNKNTGLGYRNGNHHFDHQEYAIYEKRKQDILKKGYGRAARMAGGILWRLAQDIVGEKAVTRGPSTSVSIEGSVLGSLNGFHLVDDKLTLREMDIICGVYYVGKIENQDTQMSWWPKQNIWEACGLNVGYWTVDCEAWYQRRLAEIRDGEAKLYSSTEWKQRLKYRTSATYTFRQNTNILANMLLDKRYQYWNE